MCIRDRLGHVSVKTTEIYAKTDAKLKREAIEAAGREIVPHEDAKWDSDDDLKSWLKSFNKHWLLCKEIHAGAAAFQASAGISLHNGFLYLTFLEQNRCAMACQGYA